ncbi:unnamed protein product [Pieris macdunnoughi]|uniref:Uncharacterized protein n=1 Tax=Pieris macdunnoughi TaxID=345717 RepID=A0A821MIR3_9NEOP|nr:unnamed protein product [Pieris macdunnoughi]
MSMETFKFVPREVLSLIPKYDGTENLLNLFIAKSEYVIKEFRVEGNAAQNLYLFHAITSRLVGKAATLLSENQNITSWDHFKDILTQHFGDPRSEESSNVPPQNNFKYGIPPQNNLKYGIPPQNHVKFGMPTQNNFKFGIPPQNNFKFGIPPQNNFKFGMPPQNNYRFGISPQNNSRFGIPQQNYKFGYQPQQGPRFGIPHQKQNPQPGNTDVSMRTAPIRQNMINDSEYYYEPYYYNDYCDYDNYESSETAMCENFNLLENQENSKDNEEIESQEVNFQEEASNHIPK